MNHAIGITRTRLNLRSGPGQEYPVLEVLQKGARLAVLEDMGSWLNVQSGSRLGFVDERYVLLAGVEQESADAPSPGFSGSLTGTTTARVNLREGPGLEYPVFQTVLPGTRVEVFEDLGDWLNVFYGGRLAYVHANFVAVAPGQRDETALPAPPSDNEESVEIWAVVQETEMLRPFPEDGGSVHAILGPGDEVRVLEDMGAWLNVMAGAQLGYVRAQAVKTVFRTIGVTTAVLNMRAGPGTQYSVLNVLPGDAKVEILEDLGDWLDVQYSGVRGFVHGDFVRLPEIELSPDPQPAAGRDPGAEPALRSRGQPEAVSWEQQLLTGIWARHGRLLANLAGKYDLDPHVMACALAVETAPQGFGTDGRLLLRFENHLFWEFWGQQHAAEFAQHFRFDPEHPWLGHAFRADAGQQRWKNVHAGGQSAEWRVYQLAGMYAKDAALCSVRMGAPQIPGFRHAELGFPTAEAMFAAFSENEANQVCGFFDFIRGQGDDEGFRALLEKDFLRFARFYNGRAQGEKYAAMLERTYQFSGELSKL